MIEVPAIAIGVWLLARLGIGDPTVGFMKILRLTTVFCGAAALLTAAGIGRLAAYASVDKIGGRRHAMHVAARAHAAAGAGLVLIAAIPHGELPAGVLGWLSILALGAVVGAMCGLVIGAVCGGAAPVRIGDVMAAAIKRPSEALRQLLDPEDLIKLGAAVRQRTTQMFQGVFEPAERPPDEPPAPRMEGPGPAPGPGKDKKPETPPPPK